MEEQLWKKTLNRVTNIKTQLLEITIPLYIIPSFTASDSIKEITCL